MRVGVLTKARAGAVGHPVGAGRRRRRRSPTTSDSTDLHLADTLAAGAGLCDVDAVRVLVDEGPARVHELIALGARVRPRPGRRAARSAREGGHSTPRVVHAGGAATGWEIERALVAAVQRTAAAVLERLVRPRPARRGRAVPRRRGAVAEDGTRVEVRAAHIAAGHRRGRASCSP